jgi:hypothetical protein
MWSWVVDRINSGLMPTGGLFFGISGIELLGSVPKVLDR